MAILKNKDKDKMLMTDAPTTSDAAMRIAMGQTQAKQNAAAAAPSMTMKPASGVSGGTVNRTNAVVNPSAGTQSQNAAAGAQTAGMTWAQRQEMIAQQIVDGNMLTPGMDAYGEMRGAWERRATADGQNAAELARQGAGGYGTSYAAMIGEQARDASLAAQQNDWYNEAKAAYQQRQQLLQSQYGVVSDMADREAASAAAAEQAAKEEQAAADAEAADAENRVRELYGQVSQLYDGTNERVVRSQLANLGYTQDEINQAIGMVKGDMGAAAEDMAAGGSYGNGSVYDQMAQSGIISEEQASVNKVTEGRNFTKAMQTAMQDPATAASALGFNEEDAEAYMNMNADERDEYLANMAGQAVLRGIITPSQYADILRPGIAEQVGKLKETLEKSNSSSLNLRPSNNYLRDVSNIVSTLMQDRDAGYLDQEQYENLVTQIANVTKYTKTLSGITANKAGTVNMLNATGADMDAALELIRLDPGTGDKKEGEIRNYLAAKYRW